ncbi:hypothetical protein [Mariniflexile sp. HMF6888]|uniref:hypothetical protein n=1 Tax=Mariniflexile sp. HMF6888 TaxID=3373086 RepID=UPI0037A6F0C0
MITKSKSNRSLFLCGIKQVEYSMLLFVCLVTAFTTLIAQNKKISDKNITFIDYPDFPEAHSTWGSIGYNDVFNTVYIGVTNHKDNIGLYEYDVSKNLMNLKGFVKDLAHLRPFQWQGKIHSKIVSGIDGSVYFSTDGGEAREEYLMNHPHGYNGGYFMKWDPKTNALTNLGYGLPYESIKDVAINPYENILYGVSYPQAHFLVFDIKNNIMKDMGRLASSHVPRVLFTDQWGNCYYVDWRQRLVKYEKKTKELVFAEHSLPAFEGTPGYKIITGITAFAKDQNKEVIYLITYGAKVISFKPQQEGIGEVQDLGGVFEKGVTNKWDPYVPNLNIGNNGKLYYFIGGHGNYIKKDSCVLVELDPLSNTRKIIYEFPVEIVSEVTGSNIKDKEGNLYFAGRKKSEGLEASRPFMIKFNPEKEVQ